MAYFLAAIWYIEFIVCIYFCLLIGMSPPPPSRIPPPSLPPFYRLFSPYNHTTSDTHMDLLVNDEL